MKSCGSSGCTTELDYTEQSSWLLFLKYPLDGLEQDRADEAAMNGKKHAWLLDKSYRWDKLINAHINPRLIPALRPVNWLAVRADSPGCGLGRGWQ